jgi:Fe-S-cluster containining protein
MTICSYLKSKRCSSACCYRRKKRVGLDEVAKIGLEFLVKEGETFYLRNKEEFWAGGVCTFLDEETLLCDIAHKMPLKCQIHNCYGMPNIERFLEEVHHYRKKRGLIPL